MDYLDELPVDEEKVSPVELATAQKYLNSSQKKRAKSRIVVRQTSISDIAKWAVAVTLIFLLVANPWADKIFGFLPIESPIVMFVVKAVVFFALSFAVLWKFS